MITIYNEKLISPEDLIFNTNNLGFEYSLTIQQAVIKHNNQLLFWEECYFNIMANLRKMRFSIPLHFTPEYFENQVLDHSKKFQNAKIKLLFFPENTTISYAIKIQKSEFGIWRNNENYAIDVMKEISIFPNFTAQISHPKVEHFIAKKYAEENDLQDVIFLNHEKNVARSIFGNIYFVINEKIYSNSVSDGAYKQAIDLQLEAKNDILRDSFSAFSLQKADEVFIISEGLGIISVTQFRKKEYTNSFTQKIARVLIV